MLAGKARVMSLPKLVTVAAFATAAVIGSSSAQTIPESMPSLNGDIARFAVSGEWIRITDPTTRALVVSECIEEIQRCLVEDSGWEPTIASVAAMEQCIDAYKGPER